MSVATFAQSFFFRPRSDAESTTGPPPPRRKTGPVMMGDIHAAPGGRPMLLVLWDRWEREAEDDE